MEEELVPLNIKGPALWVIGVVIPIIALALLLF
jgi:hypothetical protein